MIETNGPFGFGLDNRKLKFLLWSGSMGAEVFTLFLFYLRQFTMLCESAEADLLVGFGGRRHDN